MLFSQLKKLLIAIIIPSLVIVTVGCNSRSDSPENVFIADEADNGQAVTMGVGDALQVSLVENRSTGYMWSIVTNDEAVLRQGDGPAYGVDSDAEGAAGQVTFVFRAAGPGTSVLRMVNARQQETAVEPAATFELTVQVVE